MLIENQLIVELKSVEAIKPIHEAPLMTYMKLADVKIEPRDTVRRELGETERVQYADFFSAYELVREMADEQIAEPELPNADV